MLPSFNDRVSSTFYLKRPFVCTLVIFSAAFLQICINHPHTFSSNRLLLLLFSGIFFQLLLVKFCSAMFLPRDELHLAIIPYSLMPMALAILLNRNVALVATLYISIWGWLLVPSDKAFTFLIFSQMTGFITIYTTDQVRNRAKLLRVGLMVGVCGVMLGFVLGLAEVSWQPLLLIFGISIVSSILISGILPVLESLFKITTDMKWVELADLNHPLLKDLALKAPGTMQHSLQVANLSATAAKAIGANAEMCRACAYFHDIGKMNKANYFIENATLETNPHDQLKPSMSALIIMAHVKDGVDLALKHHLDSRIIDVIQQHHGTSTVAFFYHRALENQKALQASSEAGLIDENEVPTVNEEQFRYPGPKPQFKESAIISLADGLESMSRSWHGLSVNKITQKIEDYINERLLSGQLDDCNLSIKEVRILQNVFAHTLKSILHSRISYPKIEAKNEQKKAQPTARLVEMPARNAA